MKGKKLISTFLALIIVFATVNPAFAAFFEKSIYK